VTDKNLICASFDDEEDVLYVSLGRPVASYADESKGLIFRFSYDRKLPSGVTVVGFSQAWAAKKADLYQAIGGFLGVSEARISDAVSGALSRVTTA
jgi:hypothetical protein